MFFLDFSMVLKLFTLISIYGRATFGFRVCLVFSVRMMFVFQGLRPPVAGPLGLEMRLRSGEVARRIGELRLPSGEVAMLGPRLPKG